MPLGVKAALVDRVVSEPHDQVIQDATLTRKEVREARHAIGESGGHILLNTWGTRRREPSLLHIGEPVEEADLDPCNKAVQHPCP